MSNRVSIVMEDEAWYVLAKMPREERGRAVSAAILEWARLRKRGDAVARMDELRATLPSVSTEEVVRWLRQDRERRPSA